MTSNKQDELLAAIKDHLEFIGMKHGIDPPQFLVEAIAAAEASRPTHQADEAKPLTDYNKGDFASIEAIRALTEQPADAVKRLEEVRIPAEPSIGLLVSMAIRYDHGLGIPGYYDDLPIQLGQTHKQRMESTISVMRQLYEEVAGTGFYRPEKENDYAALKETP